MDSFVIRLKKNEANSSVLVCVDKDNLVRLSDRFCDIVKTFKEKKEAYQFIKKHKLDRKGTTAMVEPLYEIANQDKFITDHVTEGIRKMQTEMFYIYDRTTGKKICWNNTEFKYYLMKTDKFYCLWKSTDIDISIKNISMALNNPNLESQSILPHNE